MPGYKFLTEIETTEQAIQALDSANRESLALMYVARLHQIEASTQSGRMLELTVEIRDMTGTVKNLTIFIAVLTVVNVAVFLHSVFR